MTNEISHKERYQQLIPQGYRIFAILISFLFHPIFILSYAYILLAFVNPSLFGETQTERVFSFDGKAGKGLWFINIFVFSCVIPIVGILVMRGLGFVSSLSMPTQDERKIPYVLTGMFYMSLVAANSYHTSLPLEIKIFCLGATIALFIAFFINLFSKISMHTVGISGFVAMVIIMVNRGYPGSEYFLIFAFLVAGLVGTSRLLLGAHNTSDVYGGYMVGFLPQFIALSYIY